MAILIKGHTFADGDQVTSTKLNDLVDSATFDSGAVDGTTLLIDNLGYLKVGSIQTGNIATGAVTTAKLADSTGASDGVTTAKLATGAVATAKLADSAVTNDKIAATTILAAKIGNNSGTFPVKVQQVVKSDASNITSGSWQDIPGLSLSFTRINTTSKVRVQAAVSLGGNSGLIGMGVRIVRATTEVGVPVTASRTLAAAAGDYYSGNVPCTVPVDFIDDVSAVATNPLTYKLQAYVASGTGYINKPQTDTTSSINTISTMTLTELA